MTSDSTSTAARSDERSVRFDADAHTLVMAGRERPLGTDASNERVLREYVDLVAECRGRPLGTLAEVRDEDVDALALALDLDADRLVAEIEAVLGQTPERAELLAQRLRTRRLQIAGAAVAAGVVVGGAVVAMTAGGSDTAPTTPAVTTTVPAVTTTVAPETSTSQPSASASTVVDGVTLLEDAPAVENDPDLEGSTPATTIVDGVTLLEDAVTIEADPDPGP